MITKPSVAKYSYNLDGEVELSRQLATSGGREIVSILLTSGGSASAARIVDTKDGASNTTPSRKSILIAANAGESTPFTPSQPIPFRDGLYIVLEQGGPQGAEVFIEYN